MMTYDTWISETKRFAFKRSDKLKTVDTCLKNYDTTKSSIDREFLISALTTWLDSKDTTPGGTQRATAWKSSRRNSTMVDGKGTVERLLVDLFESGPPPLDQRLKNALLIYIPYKRTETEEGHLEDLDDIVQKLHNMTGITSVCKVPSKSGHNKDTILSEPKKIDYYYSYIDVKGRTIPSSDKHKISFANAAQDNGGNGKYIWFRDDRTTIADMDTTHNILVSGGFSGCQYRLYRGDGKVYGAHIYRGGSDSEANVTLFKEYAEANGWEKLLKIETKGIAGSGGVDSLITVSELKGGYVESILLKIGGAGNIVGTSQIYRT